MSKEIDQKVIEMQFDNKQFEANVHTTMSSIDRLKSKLNFDKVSDSLDNVTKASRKVDMSALEKGIEAVQIQFSALDVAAVTALQRITNAAIDTGEKLVKSLSVDQISAGWDKYGEKTSAVQTIMAATSKNFTDTGKQMEYVNAQLEKLNWFTDETSYSFLDMVSNIGKFTSNQISLKRSVTAMQGISTWAAISGANVQEAGRVMYNLSQAIAVGSVKLMDWKSIENANMATAEFKQTAIDTAVALGTLQTKADGTFETLAGNTVTVSNFNSALKDEWFTSDVLLKTLDTYGRFTDLLYNATEKTGISATDMLSYIDEYKAGTIDLSEVAEETGVSSEKLADVLSQLSDDTLELGMRSFKAAQEAKTFEDAINAVKDAVSTGWMTTFELIFGDYLEAKELWTDIANLLYDIFASGAEDRNAAIADAMNSNWLKLQEQIEQTGISYDDFKVNMEQTAREHGILIDQLIKDTGSFEQAFDALFDSGLLSRNIIAETLQKASVFTAENIELTDEMKQKVSDLGNVVEKVYKGDFGTGMECLEAITNAGFEYDDVMELVEKRIKGETVTFDELSAVVKKNTAFTEDQIDAIKELSDETVTAGDSVNEMINNLSQKSGRALMLESIENILTSIYDVMQVIKESWNDVFPQNGQLLAFITKVHDLTQKLEITDEASDKLKRTFKGLFSIVDVIATVIKKTLSGAFKILSSLIGNTNIDVLDITASIGDALTRFHDWFLENEKLNEIFETVAGTIAYCRDKVIEWVNAFMSMPETQQAISNFIGFVTTAFTGIKDFISICISTISEFISHFKEIGKINWNDQKSIEKFFASIGDELEWAGAKLSDFAKTLSEKFSGVVDFLVKVKDKIIGVFKDVFDYISEKGAAPLIAFSLGAELLIVYKLINKLFKPISEIGDAFVGVLDSLAGALNSLSTKVKSESLLNVAKSVIILAGAIALIAMIPTDRLGASVAVVAGMCAVLAMLYTLTAKLPSASSMQSTTLVIISFAAGVLLIAEALKVLDGITFENTNIITMFVTITAIATALMTMSAIMAKYAPKLSSGSIFMLSFAGSILLLVNALKKISDMNESNKINDSLLSLTGVIATLMVIALACSNTNIGGALVLISFAVTIKLLIDILKGIDVRDLGKINGTIGILYSITGALAILMIASRAAGQYSKQAGTAALGVSAAILIIIASIKLLNSLSEDEVKKGLTAVSALLGVFAVVIAASKLAGENAAKAGLMLISMSVAIGILVGIIAALSLIDSGLDRAMAVVSGLLVLMGGIIAVSKLAEKSSKSIIALTVAIGILSGALIALTILSSADPNSLLNASAAISMMIGAFALLVASTKLAEDATGTIFILLGVVAALGGVLIAFKLLGVDASFETIASISLLITALSASMLLLGIAKEPSLKAIGAVALMGLVVGEIAVIIALVQKFAGNFDITLETAAGLSILLISLSTSMLILSAMGSLGLNALAGAGILLLVLAAVGGIASLIGNFLSDNQAEKLLSGLDILITVFEKIGEAIGAIIGGFTAGLLAGLPAIAGYLSQFAEKLVPFFEIVRNNVDTQSTNNAKAMADVLLVLTAAALMDGLSRFLGFQGSYERLASGLAEFGEAMVNYAESVSALDDTKIQAITDSIPAAEGLAGLLKCIPSSDGLWQAIVGTKKWSTIGTGLTEFGATLIAYGKSVLELDDDKIDAIDTSIDAASGLAGVLNAVPGIGGTLQDFLGEKSWSTFKENLPEFGAALKGYSDAVQGVDEDAIDVSMDAATRLNDFLNKVENSGGMLADIVGDNTWGTFGDSLVWFGDVLVAYSDKVKTIDLDRITDTTSAIHEMASLMYKIGQDDFWGLAYENGAFADIFDIFTDEIASFYEGISQIDVAQFTGVVEQFSSLITAMVKTKDIDADGILKLEHAMDILGSIGVSEFIESFNTATGEIKESAINIMQSFIDGLGEKKRDLQIAYTTIAENAKSNASTIINSVSTTFSDGANDIRDGLVESGKNAVDGFIEGVTGKKDELSTKMQELGRLAYTSFNNSLEIHSPSKKFAKSGMWSAKGFSEGYSKEMANTQKAMARSTLGDTGKPITRKSSTPKRGLGSTIWNGISNTVTGIGNTVAETASNLGITDTISSLGQYINPNGSSDVSGWIAGLGDEIDELTNSVSGLGSEVSDTDSESKKSASSNSKILKQAKKEYDQLLEDYKDNKITQAEYDKKYTELSAKYSAVKADLDEYAQKQMLATSKKVYDELLEKYKNNKITQAQYDKEYTDMLEKYTNVQVDLVEYAEDEMEKCVTDKFDKITEEFESKIADIQKSMDKLSDNLSIDFKDAITISTNKDIYDQTVAEYERKIKKYNKKIEDATRTYGADAYIITVYQAEIDKINKELDKYKSDYAAKELDEDEIVKVNFTNKIKSETKEIEAYNKEITNLMSRTSGGKTIVGEDIVAMIAGLDRKEGIAVVQYLNSLTDEQLKAVQKNWEQYQSATKELSENLYAPTLENAANEYTQTVLETLDELPESAKDIGKKTVKSIAAGFSEETENTIKIIKSSGKKIQEAIDLSIGINESNKSKDTIDGSYLNITEPKTSDTTKSTKTDDTTKSSKTKNTSKSDNTTKSTKTDDTTKLDDKKNLGSSLTKTLVPQMIGNDELIDNMSNGIINGINQRADSIDVPIVPVIDMDAVNSCVDDINANLSLNIAVKASADVSDSRTTNTPDNQNGAVGNNNSGSFIFNQYNTSPKALSRREIYHDSVQGVQLANAMR